MNQPRLAYDSAVFVLGTFLLTGKSQQNPSTMTNHTCPECNATLSHEDSCQSLFEKLLSLESEVIGSNILPETISGEVIHFYAVSSYVLQHPVSMNYTHEALVTLGQLLKSHLQKHATLTSIRKNVRRFADATPHITRKEGDLAPLFTNRHWLHNVEFVLNGGPANYHERVAIWAQSTVKNLDEIDEMMP